MASSSTGPAARPAGHTLVIDGGNDADPLQDIGVLRKREHLALVLAGRRRRRGDHAERVAREGGVVTPATDAPPVAVVTVAARGPCGPLRAALLINVVGGLRAERRRSPQGELTTRNRSEDRT